MKLQLAVSSDPKLCIWRVHYRVQTRNVPSKQVLGIRGAEAVADKWKIRLQLTKPVTWVPLIWGEALRPSLPELACKWF